MNQAETEKAPLLLPNLSRDDIIRTGWGVSWRSRRQVPLRLLVVVSPGSRRRSMKKDSGQDGGDKTLAHSEGYCVAQFK